MGRIKNIDSGWAQVPNSILNDKNITMKAKGVFAYMQSKPSTWNFSAERIAEETLEGEKAMRTALKELEKAKYLFRRKYKNEGGTWEWEYILFATPYAEKPSAQKRRVDNRRIKKESISNIATLQSKDSLSLSPEEKIPPTEFNSKEWILSLTESTQDHILLIGAYFSRYAKHNFPTKEVAVAEMKKNLVPAIYLVKNFDEKDIAKTLRYCQDNYADISWNLHTVKKQITYVTAKH